MRKYICYFATGQISQSSSGLSGTERFACAWTSRPLGLERIQNFHLLAASLGSELEVWVSKQRLVKNGLGRGRKAVPENWGNKNATGRNWPVPARDAGRVNHGKTGGGGWTRTNDLRIMRPSL